jgi:hypothetical protein
MTRVASGRTAAARRAAVCTCISRHPSRRPFTCCRDAKNLKRLGMIQTRAQRGSSRCRPPPHSPAMTSYRFPLQRQLTPRTSRVGGTHLIFPRQTRPTTGLGARARRVPLRRSQRQGLLRAGVSPGSHTSLLCEVEATPRAGIKCSRCGLLEAKVTARRATCTGAGRGRRHQSANILIAPHFRRRSKPPSPQGPELRGRWAVRYLRIRLYVQGGRHDGRVCSRACCHCSSVGFGLRFTLYERANTRPDARRRCAHGRSGRGRGRAWFAAALLQALLGASLVRSRLEASGGGERPGRAVIAVVDRACGDSNGDVML